MNNLLPSSFHLHAKYDLKGSTHKRRASNLERTKPSPTYKDLDFVEQHADGLLLEFETHEALKKTIERDCRVCFSTMILTTTPCLARRHDIVRSVGHILSFRICWQNWLPC